MESFENSEFTSENNERESQTGAEPEASEPVTDGAYHATGAGRKESPYADSPYEMPHQAYEPRHDDTAPHSSPKPHKAKKARRPIWRPLVACLVVVALVAAGCSITAVAINSRWETRNQAMTEKLNLMQKQLDSASGRDSVTLIPTDGSAMTPSQLYAACVNSVVSISSTVQASSFYGSGTGSSSGSGFILTEDGYVVTNYHVVEDATAIRVILHDDTEYSAELVGQDATNDIAVLKVDAIGLPAASLGSSGALNIGDMVAAIGNPLGELASTQTIGYVSGINREVTTDSTIISMIQTDAVINPGNSGGPLFNMYGQVIGITTAKYSGTTGSGATIEGIGFAIPIDDVVPIINDLIEHGYVTGAYMGVTVMNTDAESAALYGLPTGARIEEVVKGGAADRAGLQPKDIVIRLGDYDVRNITDLTRALRHFKAGDVTTVLFLRNGRETSLEITLDEKPRETPAETQPQQPQPEGKMPGGSYEDWYDYFFSPFFGN